MHTLIRIGWLPVLVFAAYVALTSIFDIYGLWIDADIVFHLAGGLSIGVAAAESIRIGIKKKLWASRGPGYICSRP